ncbi:MAG: helix-turn-helix domain-containing protein, partial [Pseudomonadota bacterium]
MRSGMRPICAAALARESPAAASSLPEGVTRWHLMASLRGAAQSFGLTGPMLRLLEHYMDLSYEADWAPGAEPVIPVPLCEIAEALGRSERQIRNIERRLAAAGFLIWRDAANHHRKGRRCRQSGRLIWGYGPSLGPMRARAA